MHTHTHTELTVFQNTVSQVHASDSKDLPSKLQYHHSHRNLLHLMLSYKKKKKQHSLCEYAYKHTHALTEVVTAKLQNQDHSI